MLSVFKALTYLSLVTMLVCLWDSLETVYVHTLEKWKFLMASVALAGQSVFYFLTILLGLCLSLGNWGAGSLGRTVLCTGCVVSFSCLLWKVIRMYYLMLPPKSQSCLAQHSRGSGSATVKISWICTWIPADLLFPYLYQEDYKILAFTDIARNAFHKQRDGTDERGQLWSYGECWD